VLVWLGLYPQPVIDAAGPAVARLTRTQRLAADIRIDPAREIR